MKYAGFTTFSSDLFNQLYISLTVFKNFSGSHTAELSGQKKTYQIVEDDYCSIDNEVIIPLEF